MTEFDYKQNILEELLKTDVKEWSTGSSFDGAFYCYKKNEILFTLYGKTPLKPRRLTIEQAGVIFSDQIGLVNTLYEKLDEHFCKKSMESNAFALVYNKAFKPA